MASKKYMYGVCRFYLFDGQFRLTMASNCSKKNYFTTPDQIFSRLFSPRPPKLLYSSSVRRSVCGLSFWTSRLDGHKSLRLSPLILTAAGTHKHINIYQIQLYYCCWLLACWGVSNSSEIPFSELRWQRRNNRETGVDLQNDFWPSPTQKNKPTEKWQQ